MKSNIKMKLQIKMKLILNSIVFKSLSLTTGLLLQNSSWAADTNQKIVDIPIPEQAYSLLESYKNSSADENSNPGLNSKFVKAFPSVVRKYLQKNAILMNNSNEKCKNSATVQFNDESLKRELAAAGVSLGENENSFLDSLSIINGCGQVYTNNNKDVLNTFFDQNLKKILIHEMYEFYQNGPQQFCEKVEISYVGVNIGSSSSCYETHSLQWSNGTQGANLNPTELVQTWEVSNEEKENFEPIYLRSCLFLAKNSSDKVTTMHMVCIGRWQDLNMFTKEAADHIIPKRVKHSFEYAQELYGEK